MKRRVQFLGCLALLAVLMVLGIGVVLLAAPDWSMPKIGAWFTAPQSAPPSDAIVILGGDTVRRTHAGLALYHQGLAPLIVITGDDPREIDPNKQEAKHAKELAFSQGVPDTSIALLQTTSTLEDAQQISRYARDNGLHQVIIVSDWFHGRRAVCSIRQATSDDGLKIAFTAASPKFSVDNWWHTEEGLLALFTEGVKLLYYGLENRSPAWGCWEKDTNLTSLLLVWGIGFILSLVAVTAVRRFALRRSMLDIPNERSLHSVPTPRGGGLGIVGVSLGLFLIWLWTHADFPRELGLVYITTGAVVAGMGLADDWMTPLRAGTRLLTHLLAAVILVSAAGFIEEAYIPGLGLLRFWTVIGIIITLLWVVGAINAFNFMDGIDGLAGTQALLAGGAWCLLLLVEGQETLALLAGLIAVTSLGFLFLNAPPARIFMGDVGSTFLGFSFGALPVLAYREIETPRLFVTGVLFVAPFVFDTTLTIVRRLLRRESVLQAHRSHLYQRLVKIGCSHAMVSALYGILILASAISGLVYYTGAEAAMLGALLAVLGICIGLTVGVRFAETAHRHRLGVEHFPDKQHAESRNM